MNLKRRLERLEGTARERAVRALPDGALLLLLEGAAWQQETGGDLPPFLREHARTPADLAAALAFLETV